MFALTHLSHSLCRHTRQKKPWTSEEVEENITNTALFGLKKYIYYESPDLNFQCVRHWNSMRRSRESKSLARMGWLCFTPTMTDQVFRKKNFWLNQKLGSVWVNNILKCLWKWVNTHKEENIRVSGRNRKWGANPPASLEVIQETILSWGGNHISWRTSHCIH